jgi:hypothetical protein
MMQDFGKICVPHAQIGETSWHPSDRYFDAVIVPRFHTGQTHIPLDALDEMQPRNAKTEGVTYKGRKALRVVDTAQAMARERERLVILSKTEFQDGVIELELTGEPGANAGEGARGFVGLHS